MLLPPFSMLEHRGLKYVLVVKTENIRESNRNEKRSRVTSTFRQTSGGNSVCLLVHPLLLFSYLLSELFLFGPDIACFQTKSNQFAFT